jgi:hypothetical protein
MVWQRQDLWRQHPLISRGYKAAFPGLRLAIPAFAAFVVIEKIGNVLFSGGEHHGQTHIHYEKEGVGSTPSVAE